MQILDSAPGHRIPLRVTLAAKGYAMQFPEDGNVFSELANFCDHDLNWSAVCNPAGRCKFVELPAQLPFTIEISRGGEVVRRIAGSSILEAGEARDVQWRIGAGARLFGVVVDQDDRPVEHTELWLVRESIAPSRGSSSRILQGYWEDEIVARTTTDRSGAFEFPDVAVGSYWLGPAPREFDPGEEDRQGVSPEAVLTEIPADIGQREFDLRVYRGLFLDGRIFAPDGEGGVGGWIGAARLDGVGRFNGESAEDGRFALGPLPPGDYELTASSYGSDGYAKSLGVRARAGEEQLRIQLRAGSSLKGRVVDRATGEGSRAKLTFNGPGASGGVMITGTSDDGRFVQKGLLPGTYELVAVAEGDRIGFLRKLELAVGLPLTDLRIELERGARLRIRYEGKGEYCRFTVTHEGLTVAADGLRNGTSAERTVPAGRVVVVIDQAGAGRSVTHELELAAGQLEEILFAPVD